MVISEKQKNVSELLANYDPNARDVYLGALSVLDQDHLERIPQSAHSIREMLNIITRNVKFRLTTPSKKDKPKNDSHKKKLIQLVDPLGGPPEELQYQFDILEEYKEWFLGVSHHGKHATEKQFRNKLDKLESILLQIMRPHFDVITEIDDILRDEKPSNISFNKLKPLLARNVSAFDHFFTHASGDWLDILEKKGYFSKPPPIIKVQQGIRFPLWSASRYLSRIASEKPEKVLKIILKHKIPSRNERNWIILEDFINAATDMPPKLAVKIAERISKEKWADIPFYNHLDEPITELMLNLADAGYGKQAVNLAAALLDVRQGEPRAISSIFEEYSLIRDVTTVIDTYWYEEIVKNKIPKLAEKYSGLTIQLLASLLNRIISLENSGRNLQDTTEDISTVWRPSIENHEQNNDRDFRSLLVGVLADTLVEEGVHSIPKLKKHLTVVEKIPYSLFRRIELYVYRKFPKHFKHDIEFNVIKCFNKSSLKHEYYHLVKETFPQWSKKTRRQFLKMIGDGPPQEKIDYWKEEESAYGNNLVDVRTKYWKVLKLEPVNRFLNGKQKQDYDAMIKEVGAPEFPDFDAYHYGARMVEPVTDLADGLSEDDVFSFLRSHVVKGDDYDSWVTDGSKDKFQEYVEKEPLKYSKRADELLSVDSIFSVSFLSGLEKSVKAEKEIDWKTSTSFCKQILDLTNSGKYVSPKGYDILRHISSFLESGLQNKTYSLPFNLRDDIWQILLLLVKVRNEEPTWEENYPDKNWDSYGISRNTASGSTFHTIFHYAIWVHNNLKKVNKVKSEFAPEVKNLIRDYFEEKITNTISRHAVLGFQFPNLYYFDKAFALDNKSKIFSSNNEKLDRAAWDSYILNNVHHYVFKEVIDRYSIHVSRLKTPEVIDSRLSKFDDRVVEHVILAYLHKFEESNTLFEEILNTKNNMVLSHASWFVGLILKNYKEKPNKSLDLDRVRQVWLKSTLVNYGHMGWWFMNSPFSKNETIDLFLKSLKKTNGKIDFAYGVQEELESFAKSHPVKTVMCLELLFKSDEDTLSIHVGRDSTKKILKTILESKNTKAVNKARFLIHYLGTLGFNEYKELL